MGKIITGIIAVMTAIISILSTIIHSKNKKIDGLKDDVHRAEVQGNINADAHATAGKANEAIKQAQKLAQTLESEIIRENLGNAPEPPKNCGNDSKADSPALQDYLNYLKDWNKGRK